MGVKKDYKNGTITVNARLSSEADMIVSREVEHSGKLRIEQGARDYVMFCERRAALLWPIIKLYSETGKIFEGRYKVKSTGYDFYIKGSDGSISGAYKTKDAAQLVCDAMNEAARMEEE